MVGGDRGLEDIQKEDVTCMQECGRSYMRITNTCWRVAGRWYKRDSFHFFLVMLLSFFLFLIYPQFKHSVLVRMWG